jgi:formate dehydrogenase maturation protein FdhE
MTIKIGGLGQEVSAYCPVCSVKMTHRCIATLGTGKTIRYAWQCDSCELELKSDRDGNAHLLTEMELYK